MRIYSKLTIALLFLVGAVLSGCEGQEYSSSVVPLRVAAVSHENESAAIPTVFLLGNIPIYQYALSSNQGPKPLRHVIDHVGFIGVDALGNMYFTRQADYECNSPCKVTVYDITGRFKRSIAFPAMVAPYVDKAGSIYGVINGCSQIAQYAAGATGRPQPIRLIRLQAIWCMRPSTNFGFTHWRLVGDKLGRVYFLTGKSTASQPQELLVWPRGANGNVRPARRITNNDMYAGILGVQSNGSAWFLNANTQQAYVVGPKANGRQPARQVSLPGGKPISLTVTDNDQVIYLTQACMMNVGPTNGGPSTLSFPMTQKPCQSILWDATY
jgi:hypothetical protein